MHTLKAIPGVVLLDYLIPMIIVVAVSVLLFGRAVLLADPKGDTGNTFYSLTEGIDAYYEFKTAWKPRLFSNALAAVTIGASNWILAKTAVPMVKQPFDLVIGSWVAGWFALTSTFLIWAFKRRSVFYAFGLYAGITYGYITRLEWAERVYPWDMPALFFFTLFLLFFIQKKYWPLLFLIPLGTGFKETAMILCLGFLFADLTWQKRLSFLAGALGLSVLIKTGIDIYTHAPVFLTMETRMGGNEAFSYYFWDNLKGFASVFNYLINAGTLLVFYLLPSGNRNVLYLKLISIPFVLGIMLFANAGEYRIWFEMLPFSLYAMDVVIYGDPLEGRANAPPLYAATARSD